MSSSPSLTNSAAITRKRVSVEANPRQTSQAATMAPEIRPQHPSARRAASPAPGAAEPAFHAIGVEASPAEAAASGASSEAAAPPGSPAAEVRGQPSLATLAAVSKMVVQREREARKRSMGGSFQSMKQSIAPIVPPSPENQDNRVAAAEAHHDLHAKRDGGRKGWYYPAVRLLQWGEVQHAKHPGWQDLFYDLIMVAFAFQLKAYIKENLTKTEGLLGLVALSLTTLSSWSHLTSYRARYDADSPAHRMLDALEGVLTAAAQHNIVADLVRFERVNMYVFVACTIGARLIHLARRVETALVVERHTPQRKTRIEYCYHLVLEVTLLCCGFAIRRANSMFYFLIAIWLVNMLMLTVPVMVGWSNRLSAVPMHVEYFLTRRGELIMLMLGEGVLALVLSSSPITLEYYLQGGEQAGGGQAGGSYDGSSYGLQDAGAASGLACAAGCVAELAKGTVGFAGAFMILNALMYLYYRANPTGHGARHHHAIRRSAMRGVLWNASHYPLAIGLIALGVSVSLIQPYAAKPVPGKYVLLYCISLAFSISMIGVQKIFHPGWALYLRAPGKTRRLALGAVKLVLAYLALVMASFPFEQVEGYLYLLLGCALAGASAVCVVLEKSPKAEEQLWQFVDEQEQADRRRRRIAHALTLESVLEDVERSAHEARAMLAAEEREALEAQQAETRAAATPSGSAHGSAPLGLSRMPSAGVSAGVSHSVRAVRSRALSLQRLANQLQAGEDESGSDEELDADEATAIGAQGNL